MYPAKSLMYISGEITNKVDLGVVWDHCPTWKSHCSLWHVWLSAKKGPTSLSLSDSSLSSKAASCSMYLTLDQHVMLACDLFCSLAVGVFSIAQCLIMSCMFVTAVNMEANVLAAVFCAACSLSAYSTTRLPLCYRGSHCPFYPSPTPPSLSHPTFFLLPTLQCYLPTSYISVDALDNPVSALRRDVPMWAAGKEELFWWKHLLL